MAEGTEVEGRSAQASGARSRSRSRDRDSARSDSGSSRSRSRSHKHRRRHRSRDRSGSRSDRSQRRRHRHHDRSSSRRRHRHRRNKRRRSYSSSRSYSSDRARRYRRSRSYSPGSRHGHSGPADSSRYGSSDYDHRYSQQGYGNAQGYYYGQGPDRYDPNKAYSSNLEAGLDGDLSDGELQGYEPRQQQASSTLHVAGIPQDKDEAAIMQSFSAWPGLMHMRLSRDSYNGRSRGVADLEFESSDAARCLMDDHMREAVQIDGAAVDMQYSYSHRSHGAVRGSTVSSGAHDWLCPMCQGVNFFRRLECYQCSAARPAQPQRVSIEADGPCAILKVSNLEPHIGEPELSELFSQQGPLREVRMVRDKFTGAPRGFAFVHFQTVADSARALQTLQNAPLTGQSGLLRLCFARDRHPETRPIPSGPAADALQAGQAMQAYSTWQPKEFDSASAEQAAGGTAVQQDGSTAASDGQNGFVYDSASGYYYDSTSGYYYDANSGLYFHSETQSWYQQDSSTGEMKPCSTDGATDGSTATTSAADSAIAATNAAVAEVQALASLTAPDLKYEPLANAPVRQKGAVIGSAAKLNSQGLMAAAELAREKEAARLKQEAAAARKAQKLAKPQGTGLAAAAAIMQPSQALSITAATPSQQAVAALPAAAAVGQIKGVIRSSGKWGKPRTVV